jgi:arsenate reductase
MASVARKAASCHPPKLTHLIAAPPLENKTAAVMILDLGLIVARNILGAVDVQIFGIRKSADTRAALRFFAERRIKVHFVDLNEKAASVGELRRFAQKFGIAALVDRESRRFAELGLRSAILSEERWLEKLSLEPLLLRMPLVRCQQQLTIGGGAAAETWNAWYAAAKS